MKILNFPKFSFKSLFVSSEEEHESPDLSIVPPQVEAFSISDIIHLHCLLRNILRRLEVDLQNVGRDSEIGYPENILPDVGKGEEWYCRNIRQLHAQIKAVKDNIAKKRISFIECSINVSSQKGNV